MAPHLAIPWGSGIYLLHAYSLCLGLFLLGALAVLARHDARAREASRGTMPRVEAFLLGVPVALLVGRVMEVWLDWPSYRAAPLRALVAPDTPVAIYGALGGGIVAAALRLRALDGSLLGFLDECTPLMLAGEGVTRIGCFLQGCCYGKPTTWPWGVSFPVSSPAFVAQSAAGLLPPAAVRSLPVHPTQLYSAAAALLVLLVACRRGVRAAPGTTFALGIGLYAVSRFVIETVRADPGRGQIAGLTGPQAISVGILLALATLALVRGRRAPAARGA
jgi:phosphatidylglycerol:prolipoprotein diacylglycerol transferase